jgi:hypothetical protein
MEKATAYADPPQGPALAAATRTRLRTFLRPLLGRLAVAVDVRLVHTLGRTVEAILRLRDRPHALLLTELGRLLLGGDRAPAGVKRLHNLLASPDWSPAAIERWLWEQADTAVERAGEEALVVFDQSVLEQPESRQAGGLCPVRSARARRLARPRPGFGAGPPGRTITVPGRHWLAVIVTGLTGPAALAACDWWTTRGPDATDQRAVEYAALEQTVRRWGRRVLHVFDRGFAGSPFLTAALGLGARVVVRWPKRYHLTTPDGRAGPAWRLTAGKRAWGGERVWDARRRAWLAVRFLAIEVRLPGVPATPLWLVVARGRPGTEPWRLLTNEPITSVEAARRIVRAYARRWQVECAIRFGKSELGLESPRLQDAIRRQKLLGLATLAYAFLVHLLTEATTLVPPILRQGCHRTGRAARAAPVPLYRLRAAVAELWHRFLPHPIAVPLGVLRC